MCRFLHNPTSLTKAVELEFQVQRSAHWKGFGLRSSRQLRKGHPAVLPILASRGQETPEHVQLLALPFRKFSPIRHWG